MNATRRRTIHGPIAACATVALLVLLAAAPPSARAQDADGEGGADADTGWVEIGGPEPGTSTTDSPFGEDDPFADLPEVDDTPEEKGGSLRPYLDYNRVDQWIGGIDMRFDPETGWRPGFRLRGARAFQRQRPDGDGRNLYEMAFTFPLLPSRKTRLDLSLHRWTDDDGFGQIGSVENAAATFFYRWDFRDWFEREGFTAQLTSDLGARASLFARWTADDFTSITELADGTAPMFRQDEPMRENPAIDDGGIRSVTLGAGYDSRASRDMPTRGMWHRVSMETSGGGLGGDFTFHRWLGDFRAYVSPSPSHRVKTRVMLGTSGTDDVLPLQRTFAIGGVGTLRATPFRQYRGDHLFLWNADWAWEVFRRSSKNVAIKTGLSVVAFSDFGLAWEAPQWDLGSRRPAWNLGLGLGTTDERLRVYAGKDMRVDNAAIHWTVRVAQTY